MSQPIIRKNTISVDLHGLNHTPEIADIHVLIQNSLPATVDNIVSLALDTYKKCIYIKTISALVAEKFINYCEGHIAYVYDHVTYTLPVRLVEDDYISVHVATVPYECSNEQLKHFFSQFGEIARVVQLNHAKHLIFPVDSGRRLVVYKKLNVNIPQHVEIGGFKLRVSYTSQVKVCGKCGGNHLQYACTQNSAAGVSRMNTIPTPPQPTSGPTVLAVTVSSRKRLLSNGFEEEAQQDSILDQTIVAPHAEDPQDAKQNDDMDVACASSDHLDDNQSHPSPSPHLDDLFFDTMSDHTKTAEGYETEQSSQLDYNKDFPEASATKQMVGRSIPSPISHSNSPGSRPPTGVITSPSDSADTTSFAARASAMVTSLLGSKLTATEPNDPNPKPPMSVSQDSKKKKVDGISRSLRSRTGSQREKK